MPLSLLKSQVNTLEEPKYAVYIKDSLTIKEQIEEILKEFMNKKGSWGLLGWVLWVLV